MQMVIATTCKVIDDYHLHYKQGEFTPPRHRK